MQSVLNCSASLLFTGWITFLKHLKCLSKMGQRGFICYPLLLASKIQCNHKARRWWIWVFGGWRCAICFNEFSSRIVQTLPLPEPAVLHGEVSFWLAQLLDPFLDHVLYIEVATIFGTSFLTQRNGKQLYNGTFPHTLKSFWRHELNGIYWLGHLKRFPNHLESILANKDYEFWERYVGLAGW